MLGLKSGYAKLHYPLFRVYRLLKELSNKEQRQCRICFDGDNSPTNPLLTPCLCSGSLRFTHLDCLKTWIQARVERGQLTKAKFALRKKLTTKQ